MQPDQVVTTVRGEKVRVNDVIVLLKLKGQFREAIYELIEQKVIRIEAAERGLTVPDPILDRCSVERRVALGVEDDERFARYLRFIGASEGHWRDAVYVAALRDMLKCAVVPPARVQEVFASDPLRFATASLARVLCRSRRDADQVMAEAAKRDFVELAARYSIDEATRLSGGFVGHVKAAMLAPDVAKTVFAADPGAVVGPFRDNAHWAVYKVHAINEPKLNETQCKTIRDQIFQEWLRDRVLSMPA